MNGNTRKQALIRVFCALVAVTLVALAPLHTQAEGGFSAKGTVVAPDGVTLTAPVGGQVGNFSWVPGDSFGAQEVAFNLKPAQVYAANDGVVRGLKAQVGDQAAGVMAQFGALCHIDREDVWQVEVSASTAYNEVENRDIRVGDVLRVRQGTGDDAVTGIATVIRLVQRGFVVELAQGDFELEDKVKVFLGEGKTYNSEDQVGNGKIARVAALPVQGDGVIAEVLVTEGQSVTRGQALFTLDSAPATHKAAPAHHVAFDTAGLVSEVLVRPGQFVVQGQAVMTVLPTEALTATLDVDELDIAKVEVGKKVRVVADAYAGREFVGTVQRIQPIGTIVLDTTKYHVEVAFADAEGLMIGMHVTGYWD